MISQKAYEDWQRAHMRETDEMAEYKNLGQAADRLAGDILRAAQGMNDQHIAYASAEEGAEDKAIIEEDVERFLEELRGAFGDDRLVREMARLCLAAQKFPIPDIRASVFSIAGLTESMLRGDLSYERMRALAKSASVLRARADDAPDVHEPDDEFRPQLWQMCGEIERAALRRECVDKIGEVERAKEPLAAAAALAQFAERFSDTAANMQTKPRSLGMRP